MPYPLPGWGAIFLLLPLALTSTDWMVRLLGGKLWKRLHYLVFPAVALAIWHQTWTEMDAGTNDYHRATYAIWTFGILVVARVLLKLRRTIATRLSRAR
jgi:sulfoxide reductase heme-binding subunit YedZ